MQRFTKQVWDRYEKQTGPDGQWLLGQLEGGQRTVVIKVLSEVQVLKTVWAQQFRDS